MSRVGGFAISISWRGDARWPNERPAFVVSGADWLTLVEAFGLTSQLEDNAGR
jgi:hypothetical protein